MPSDLRFSLWLFKCFIFLMEKLVFFCFNFNILEYLNYTLNVVWKHEHCLRLTTVLLRACQTNINVKETIQWYCSSSKVKVKSVISFRYPASLFSKIGTLQQILDYRVNIIYLRNIKITHQYLLFKK